MPLEVEFAKSASKDVKQLEKKTQKRIFAALKELQSNPHPRGVEKIKGHPAFLRLRVGDFRVIYHIYEDRLIVVLLVRDRKDAYESHALKTLDRKLERTLEDNVVELSRKSRSSR